MQVLSHYGIYKNGTVDSLAKKDADFELIGSEPFCEISILTVRKGIKQLINDLSRKHFTDAPGMIHSKSMIAIPEQKMKTYSNDYVSYLTWCF